MPEETEQRLCHETQAYEWLLCGHLQGMSARLRDIPAAQWDYTPDIAAPTPRILTTHAWQWLICDRYHIAEPDARKHPSVPDAPTDPQAMCDALDLEIDQWRQLLRSLTPEQLDAPRQQFNLSNPLSVRWFVLHMIQNCIYKHGQLATLYFALGLDGTDAYNAPFPNPIYLELCGPRETSA